MQRGCRMSKPGPNKRRAERIRQDRMIAITPIEFDKLGRETLVSLRDFSPRGVGLWRKEPLALNSQFVLSLEQRVGAAPHLLYQVVRCEGPLVGGYSIGAEFVCVVTDADLH